MKKRNPLAVFFLSIVTFGIYDLYWLVVTKKELNQRTQTKIPTIWLLFAPVVVLIGITIALLVYNASSLHTTSGTVTTYTTSNLTTSYSPGTGSSGSNIALLLVDVVAILVVLPISFYWFWKFSKSVNEYTSGTMSTAVAFLLLWLLHLIGVALVQDKFNDMMDQGAQAQALPPSPMPQNPTTVAPNQLSTPVQQYMPTPGAYIPSSDSQDTSMQPGAVLPNQPVTQQPTMYTPPAVEVSNQPANDQPPSNDNPSSNSLN